MKRKTAIVIGSGLGGMAAALRLRSKGYRVTVLEADSKAGGKLNEFNLGKYRFDYGPSLFTLPENVSELFSLFGENPDEHFKYIELDEICRYFYSDGLKFSSFTSPQKFAVEIESKLGISSNILKEYLTHIERVYDTTAPVFLERPLRSWRTLFSKAFLRGMSRMKSFDLGITMSRSNEKRLKHPALVQYFNRMATYNGSNPYAAPGILKVVGALEHTKGAFFPIGGMYAIVRSLYELSKRQEIQFEFNQQVKKILIDEAGKAIGVETKEGKRLSDLVVCNMDIYKAYETLLPQKHKQRRSTRLKPSSSALVFYWGIKRSFPEMGLHNIFFSSDYEREFECLFEKGIISEDPTLYVNISSKLSGSDAPDNCENWFVMVNAPYNQNQDWETIRTRTREIVIRRLSKELKLDIEDLIVEESFIDPILIEEKTMSHRGAMYGTSSNNMLSAFLRHPNKKRKYKNLLFVGGSVHPGGGIPLVLQSAKIAVEQVEND